MARYPGCEPLYPAFEKFLDQCLLQDHSLLWPDAEVWTMETVADLKRRIVDTPAFEGKRSFEEKLREQMQGASPEHWLVLADVYYVYFLPSLFITFEKKLSDIRRVAEQGGRVPPPRDQEVWEAQRAGFTRTAQRYHYKIAQFLLILLFAHRVKGLASPEEVVRSPERMQRELDELLEGIPDKNARASDMRDAMLYLAFPDRYERIISTRDKKRILDTYRGRIEGPVPEDLDQAILKIREIIARERGPFDFYDDLEDEWRNGGPPPPRGGEDKDEKAVLATLGQTRNVILYGPPGTGKTYIAKKAAEAFVSDQIEEPLSETALIRKAIEGLPAYEVLALSMYREGGERSYSVPEIQQQPVVRARFQFSPVKRPPANIWGRLQEHTDPESETVGIRDRREPYLFDKDDKSRWFLTERGREYVEENLADQLEGLRPGRHKPNAADFVEWVTFHQSYTYEDFVEGLRPIEPEEESGEISYRIVPGVFRRICHVAKGDPEKKYVLVVDEINRGNIAKILGELITLLEDDKREGGENALSITLPYSGDEFSVPGNLYIIGTMNTADRSIALLDVALRRRFAFIELMPRPELLDDAQVESEVIVRLGELLRSLNGEIRRHLDRDHQIGHSYFLEVAHAEEEERVGVLEFVWNNRIVPLLEEYFYSQRDKLAEILAPFRTDVESQTEPEEEDEAGFELGRQTGEDLIAALAMLAEGQI
jgi:MoxR-like ATPase